MGKIENSLLRRTTGSVGGLTFAYTNGQTIVKEKVPQHNKSKSYAQMVRRVRWANIVNFWQAFNNTLKPSFQDKPRTWSDFNAFMSANIDGVPVYLTSEEASQGAVVVPAYQITRGSLPSIAVQRGTGDVPVTNIALGTLAIDEDTSLRQFSNAVINNNPGFRHLDQISCYIVTQTQSSVTGIPYVEVKALEVTLNQNDDETLLQDIVSAEGFSVVDGKLGASGAVVGGIAWVHSRKESSRCLVSTQDLVVNNALLSQYQTAAKRQEAIISYDGKLEREFLVPNTDEAISI